MNTGVVYEPYAIEHPVPYPDGDLCITWSDLRNATVGQSWSVDDQDCYPNRNVTWEAVYTVVYKDETGVLVKGYNINGDEKVELVWYQFC